ncbi:MAG: A/G-specific adenine glycosylase [Phycisphaerales bacterium]|nr:A/G-specific adenine glycosylase [Phycisphaerales bacterium]
MTDHGANAPPRRTTGDHIDARAIARALETWFRTNARDLPWRQPTLRNGYAALVSEAMLQQTQVSRVVEAFTAFMTRFPDIAALAAAPEQEVLASWNGLGYYRRARLLHAAAKAVVAEHDGRVPDHAAELERLPGVGQYTAGAVASIVHGERTPIVDGNVFRVLVRLHGRDAEAGQREDTAWAWSEAARLVEVAEEPGTLNEALMELGATVCTPRNPCCDGCPLSESCRARRNGTVESLPRPKRTPGRAVVHHHAVPVVHRGRVLLVQRPATGLWASMWQVPTIEAPRRLPARSVAATLESLLGEPLGPLRRHESFVHLTTHREVRFEVLRQGAAGERRPRLMATEGRWCSATELDGVPMSNPQRRIAREAIERE